MIKLITSRLGKHLTLVFAGNIFAAFLGFLAVLIISRSLNVHDFGLFNMSISTMLIAANVSGLGMNIALIKFTSSYLVVKKNAEAAQVLKTTFLVRVAVSTIISILIFITAELLASKIFHYPGLAPLFKLAAFGIFAISIFNYLKAVLYTYQWYRLSVIVQILVDFGKLAAVFVFIFYLKGETFNAVAAFAFVPLIGALLILGLIWQKFFTEGKPIQNLFRKLFSYSKWLFTSHVCSITLPYVGIFMLAKMLSSEAAGIYGLALNLTYIFPIITYSLNSVLLPEVSRYKERTQLDKYLKGSLKISLCIGFTILPFLFFSHKIILFFFGSRYLDAVPIFNWLIFSCITLTIASTIRVILHTMNLPHVLAMVDMLNLMILVIGCYLLIPILGPPAPAIMSLIVNISTLGFLTLYAFKQIRSRNRAFPAEDIITQYHN